MGVMGDWFSAECSESVISFAKKKRFAGSPQKRGSRDSPRRGSPPPSPAPHISWALPSEGIPSLLLRSRLPHWGHPFCGVQSVRGFGHHLLDWFGDSFGSRRPVLLWVSSIPVGWSRSPVFFCGRRLHPQIRPSDPSFRPSFPSPPFGPFWYSVGGLSVVFLPSLRLLSVRLPLSFVVFLVLFFWWFSGRPSVSFFFSFRWCSRQDCLNCCRIVALNRGL